MTKAKRVTTRTIVTISIDDKQWLESYSRLQGVSSAETIRLAIKEYRGKVSQGGIQCAVRETAGKWKSLSGDSQEYIDALRDEWERRS